MIATQHGFGRLFAVEEVSADEVRDRVLGYCASVIDGSIVAGRWIRLAAKRFLADAERPDLVLSWEEVAKFATFCAGLPLVLSHAGQEFRLLDWQLFVAAHIYGFRWAQGGRRRFRFIAIQVARKAGKSTFMAAVGLYDLRNGRHGNRVHVIANKKDQAAVILDTAREMHRQTWPEDREAVKHNRIVLSDRDGILNALTSQERTLDGLNPSCWIGDEASEWRGRFITKLLTAQGAREDAFGVIVTTPGNNRDLVYTSDIVEVGQKVLEGELALDANAYLLFGIDEEDDPADEACWIKGNPGLSDGMPSVDYLREQWRTMSLSPVGRAEFCRFHGARFSASAARWLDMSYWDEGSPSVSIESLRGRAAWIGVDLSKCFDLSAVVVAVPLDDGRVALLGRYWWPQDSARDREVEYGVPLRRWADEHRIVLTPGREISYEAVRAEIQGLSRVFDVRQIAFDRWGSKYFAETLATEDRLPLIQYGMDIGTVGPGSQIFQNLWVARRFMHGNDPILRRCCADANAISDTNGNIRPIKSSRSCVIDGLMAALMAVHSWSLTHAVGRSQYETQGLV